MGIVEKILLDDVTMRAIELRAKDAGKTLDDEAAELIKLGLQAAESREALIARARAFRDSLPPQSTDSLTLLREDRWR
jgi:hypothetical protein